MMRRARLPAMGHVVGARLFAACLTVVGFLLDGQAATGDEAQPWTTLPGTRRFCG